MKASEKSEYFYNSMPLYVTESHEKIDGKYLPILVKDFKWKSESLKLTICPAYLVDNAGREAYYYPGEKEALIEKVLRLLAVVENKNFQKKELFLFFTLKQFLLGASYITNELIYNEDEIDLGINILASVQYQVTGKKKGLNFSPIIYLDKNRKKEDIFYHAKFSIFFFSQTDPFNFCFDDFTAKN